MRHNKKEKCRICDVMFIYDHAWHVGLRDMPGGSTYQLKSNSEEKLQKHCCTSAPACCQGSSVFSKVCNFCSLTLIQRKVFEEHSRNTEVCLDLSFLHWERADCGELNGTLYSESCVVGWVKWGAALFCCSNTVAGYFISGACYYFFF